MMSLQSTLHSKDRTGISTSNATVHMRAAPHFPVAIVTQKQDHPGNRMGIGRGD